ncbi:two-component system OmpR family response regulator [Lysobacter enzymogenes]|jgi:two-component system OmpR family response regulator/two-component system response regulator RstA|uniref:winged helix-turn-helix domain-containing protein n=1 Tax=Lysobacter enzymogenes TaxID=69 RepID=UPI0008942106|nr:winged helix-turn-helix domain-containing protein [Lysobacter enzymogenes]SDX26627.1 two-component system, OmpR family, response regulator/two-component system, OmpR family, response regulator RstA [Lysobacter enzymogenes]
MTDILLIEDDERLGSLVANYLGKHGYDVALETDGARAVAAILELQPAVVLLDLSLPGQDGFEICRAVRSRYAGVICMLTARTDDIDQVLGLELGADDYIGKPIEPRVLLARLRAHLRRDHAARHSGRVMRFGQLRIDCETREATLREARIDLTTAEFDLLVLLAGRAGQILSRDDLLQALRGIQFDGLDRSIDARISRLRRKLGDLAEEPERIKTVRGKGYLFNRAAWE